MEDEAAATFYRQREAKELDAADKAADPIIRRLHLEMADRYAHLAVQAEKYDGAAEEASALPPGTPAF